MNLILNSYCNLKCNYCFADEYMEETVNTPGKSMDYDYFTTEMLPKIQTAGVINFMGGEPTLHPRFNEIFSATLDAMSPYSNLGLFTNGLMKDHVLDLLEHAVSVQGSIQKHITFSVLLNWQTLENISEKNHQRCHEVARQLLRRHLPGDRPAAGQVLSHPREPGVSHRRRNR
jgi:molybdenum cofactor biosynthesis enzyme MoaA